MKLHRLTGLAVLCSALLHSACFTSTGSVARSIHAEHDRVLAVWLAPGGAEVCCRLTGESGAATVRFELLDHTDKVIANAERTARLSGDTHVTARLPVDLSSLDDSSRETLKWDRLRYTVTSEGETHVETVSVVDAIPDLFALRLTAPARVEAGTQYRVTAHTSDPMSNDDVSGVSVVAILKSDDAVLTQSEVKTDENGTALLALPLKADSPGEARLVLNAFKDGAFETQTTAVRIEPMLSVSISTDKPLYQPGQAVHCRILLLGEESHRALADNELKLTLANSRGETVASASERTDRFGVAAHDFKLADEIDLGKYTLRVATSESRTQANAGIEVSRYELPAFAVTAEPDKKFYLEGEDPRITLSADYLFGKPVEAGRVRIVADEGAFDPKRQRSRNGFSGVVSHGRVEIRVGPLRAVDRSYHRQFEDRDYSAYVTDASTGRTEQTRFKLRVSIEALHVYVRSEVYAVQQLPIQFYLSTYYPDGSPAECDVELDVDRSKYRSTVRSNQYGLAKVTTDYVAPFKKNEGSRWVPIKARAHDGRGHTGKTEDQVMVVKSDRLRVMTNHSIYRTGEDLPVTVLVPGTDLPVRLEAIKDGRVTAAETLKPVEGRASTTLHWNSSFEGIVTLEAYKIGYPETKRFHRRPSGDELWYPYGRELPSSTSVLFEPLTRLNVEVQLARPALKPGEQADVEFHVTDAGGKPIETCLGVKVIDKAVSTLSDGNQRISRDYLSEYLESRWGRTKTVAGMNLNDLLSIDFSKPVADDLSLVGELLLQWRRSDLQRASARDFEPFGLYQPLFSNLCERVAGDLASYYDAHRQYPSSRADLAALVPAAGGGSNLLDPWGVEYRVKLEDSKILLPRWNGKLSAFSGWTMATTTNVWTRTRTIAVTSAGPDHLFGTTDDIKQDVISFPANPLTGNSKGAIHGYVFGSGSDASVSQVRVRAVHIETGASFETVTWTHRNFLLADLPAGMYRVSFESNDSNRLTLVDVIAASGTRNELSVSLSAEGEPPVVRSTDKAVRWNVQTLSLRNVRSVLRAALVTSIGGRSGQSSYSPGLMDASYDSMGRRGEPLAVTAALPALSAAQADSSLPTPPSPGEPFETPRLRQHFPETLIWKPQIITDATGTARLNFPVADSITTWQLAVVGSTVDGRLGSGSAEIRAFQDFIAEPQSPPVLTEGDEISLPVVLRNYSDQPHAVNITLDPADWFTLQGSNVTQLDVTPNVASRAEFRVRAQKPGDFSSRITAAAAAGSGAGDAIERPVRVSVDGREIVATQGDMVDRQASYEFEIPGEAVPGSARALVRLYPKPLAGVLAAIQGMAQRPWGCLEQTLSSTYGNVLVLRYLKQHGRPSGSTADWEKLERQARNNLEDGYQRVLSFHSTNGGFTYFGEGEGDIALTAYALRFLADASEFISMEDGTRNAARQWLLRKQQPDGSWRIAGHSAGSRPGYAATAYVTGALAATGSKDSAELQRAFDYLDRNRKAMTDPYTLALYAMAARAAGNHERSAGIAQQLAGLAIRDRDGAHWMSPHRTLFYGWGRGGEIETTAVALQALVAQESVDEEAKQLVNQGLLFLARTRDYQASWHSTQATLLALQALMISVEDAKAGANGGTDLVINGKKLKTIVLDAANGSDAQAIEIDLTPELQAGANSVELRSGSGRVGVQLVSRYFVRWDEQQLASSNNLSLKVTADKDHAAIGEPVTYTVAFKRGDWAESGMSILEVGLPPGADVDRATLQALLSSGRITKYSITPGNMIFYVWPNAATTRFSFTIRPRLAMRAQTSPSLAYDYYNPDLRQALAPSRLTVQ